MITFPKFDSLPADARIWLYVSDRVLTEQESSEIQSRLDRFLDDWSSHGRVVSGAAQVAESRIVAIAATVPQGDISGCGIDKSVHVLEQAGTTLGITWLTGLHIAYRDSAGAIQVVSRPAFRGLVRDNSVSADTPVVDLTLDSLDRLRQGGLELPLRDSWHAQVFGLATPTTA